MNEFENKLRCRRFLPPPARLREAVLASGERPQTRAQKSWGEWLWPSPLAWGAAAAVLLAAILINSQLSARSASARTSRPPQTEPPRPVVYAFFQERHNLDWLQGTP
jgi:hypothetical protein